MSAPIPTVTTDGRVVKTEDVDTVEKIPLIEGSAVKTEDVVIVEKIPLIEVDDKNKEQGTTEKLNVDNGLPHNVTYNTAPVCTCGKVGVLSEPPLPGGCCCNRDPLLDYLVIDGVTNLIADTASYVSAATHGCHDEVIICQPTLCTDNYEIVPGGLSDHVHSGDGCDCCCDDCDADCNRCGDGGGGDCGGDCDCGDCDCGDCDCGDCDDCSII